MDAEKVYDNWCNQNESRSLSYSQVEGGDAAGGREHNEEVVVADEDSGGRAAHVLVVLYSPVAGVENIPRIKAHT